MFFFFKKEAFFFFLSLCRTQRWWTQPFLRGVASQCPLNWLPWKPTGRWGRWTTQSPAARLTWTWSRYVFKVHTERHVHRKYKRIMFTFLHTHIQLQMMSYPHAYSDTHSYDIKTDTHAHFVKPKQSKIWRHLVNNFTGVLFISETRFLTLLPSSIWDDLYWSVLLPAVYCEGRR